MLQKTPIQLGNFSFKRANIEQQYEELTRRQQLWGAEGKKYNMEKPTPQSINIFKGLLLNLERISDLLLYQSFCFSKIVICARSMVEEIKRFMWTEAKDCKITPLVAMLKKFIRRNRQPSQDQKEYDQYCLQLETKDQANKAYPLQKFDYDIYLLLMIMSGRKALEHIAISKSHQERVNLMAQALEKSLPQVRQSEQQKEKVVELFAELTIYAMPLYAEHYKRKWIHLRRSILTYSHLIKDFEIPPKKETFHHS